MKRTAVSAFATIVLLIIAVYSATVNASITVGIKKGDWIEYNVGIPTFQAAGANITFPPDHNVTWARMDVIDVQGSVISLRVQSMFANGTVLPENITLNLATGKLGDDFVIPENLGLGDSFYDTRQGNITITGIEQQTVAGAQRTVIIASTNETNYTWDQATGMLVNAATNITDYTLVTQTNSTNLWASTAATASPENTLSPSIQPPVFDPTIIYVAVGTAAIIIVIGIIIALRRTSLKAESRKHNNR